MNEHDFSAKPIRLPPLGNVEEGIVVYWYDHNKDAKFCTHCGEELEVAQRSAGFDASTGQRVIWKWKYCPRQVQRNFLWWSWLSYCTNITPDSPPQPHEM